MFDLKKYFCPSLIFVNNSGAYLRGTPVSLKGANIICKNYKSTEIFVRVKQPCLLRQSINYIPESFTTLVGISAKKRC